MSPKGGKGRKNKLKIGVQRQAKFEKVNPSSKKKKREKRGEVIWNFPAWS